METNFSHLLGDIRQPVLVLGDDPDAAGNVLVAPFLPAQSVPAANVYDSPLASPADTVEPTPPPADPSATPSDPGQPADGSSSATPADSLAQPGQQFTDNGDGTWTRTTDGVVGHFTPDGFVASGGEQVTGIAWGGAPA